MDFIWQLYLSNVCMYIYTRCDIKWWWSPVMWALEQNYRKGRPIRYFWRDCLAKNRFVWRYGLKDITGTIILVVSLPMSFRNLSLPCLCSLTSVSYNCSIVHVYFSSLFILSSVQHSYNNDVIINVVIITLFQRSNVSKVIKKCI